MKDNQAHLDAEAIQLAEGWQSLRRAQEAVDAREKAVAARELAQSEREGIALRELANERLEHGISLLLDPAMSAPIRLDDRSLDAVRQRTAEAILRAGIATRGQTSMEEEEALSLSSDPRARAAAEIVRCGAIARGEIATDELPPGTAGDDDLTAQRRATAAAIIQAGKQRRAEV